MKSKKHSESRPAYDTIVPLRKHGPLRPAPRRGVSISFGIDLDDDNYLVIRWPDGTITRDKLDLDDDDGGQPMGAPGRSKDGTDR